MRNNHIYKAALAVLTEAEIAICKTAGQILAAHGVVTTLPAHYEALNIALAYDGSPRAGTGAQCDPLCIAVFHTEWSMALHA